MKSILAACALLLAMPVHAAEKCPKTPSMNRQTKIALLIKASHTGYRDIRITEGCGCYEVRAIKDGVKTRVWYDPETLRPIRSEPAG